MKRAQDRAVFVTGATGYIGSRLVPRLLESGYRVRCLARSPEKLRERPWADDPRIEIVVGGAEDRAVLAEGMKGCGAAYYLIHSMLAAGAEYSERDRELAEKFAAAAETAGCERIIYLGGLGETESVLSEHLTSRREVESALASRSVPVTVLRAAMIIGSGSSSFEILRYLVERLPVMITPRWVSTESQPIAVGNVLFYLIACLESPTTVGRVLDVGGPEILSYREIMAVMAAALELPRRRVIPVPVLTPRLSSLWIHLVTPMSHRIAMPLAEGLRNRVVCRNDAAARLMPQRLLSVEEAIEASLGKLDRNGHESSRNDALPTPGDPAWAGGAKLVTQVEAEMEASPEQLFSTLFQVDDQNARLAIEGLRSWCVTAVRPKRFIELLFDRKLPGKASLGLEVRPVQRRTDLSQLVLTAVFRPKGLTGLVYGYASLPFWRFFLWSLRRSIGKSVQGTTKEGSRDSATQPADGSMRERLSVGG